MKQFQLVDNMQLEGRMRPHRNIRRRPDKTDGQNMRGPAANRKND